MKHIGIALSTLILLAGCGSTQAPKITQKPVYTPPVQKKQVPLPPKPKKDIKLKEVQDTNYSPEYMYPQNSVKKPKVEAPVAVATPAVTSEKMNKEECIAMISQEKFDKYTAMFGSESASIKRCNMIKAMNH